MCRIDDTVDTKQKFKRKGKDNNNAKFTENDARVQNFQESD